MLFGVLEAVGNLDPLPSLLAGGDVSLDVTALGISPVAEALLLGSLEGGKPLSLGLLGSLEGGGGGGGVGLEGSGLSVDALVPACPNIVLGGTEGSLAGLADSVLGSSGGGEGLVELVLDDSDALESRHCILSFFSLDLQHLFCDDDLDRESAKVRLFAWLYNPNSEDDLLNGRYNRQKLLKESWEDGRITTKFDRTIEVDERRALNYIIQSTSSDLFLRQMIKVDKMLEGKKSFIAFSVHDSLVMDFAEEDIHLLEPIIEEFSNTPFGKYLTNVSMGKNYGNMRKVK